MLDNELIRIGKLKKIVNVEQSKTEIIDIKNQKKTQIQFKPLSSFDEALLEIEDFFLLIDNKIRFISPAKIKKSGSIIDLYLTDLGLVNEINEGKIIYLAVENGEYSKSRNNNRPCIGMSIVYNGVSIAKVIDLFFNGAHNVIVAETNTGKEILIPDVSEFIIDKDFDTRIIKVIDIDDLLILND